MPARRALGLAFLVTSNTTKTGRMCFHTFGALAEFEHDLIVERVTAGLAASRARGRKGGRKTVMTPQRIEQARSMIDAKSSITDVAETLGVSRTTLYRHLELGAATVTA